MGGDSCNFLSSVDLHLLTCAPWSRNRCAMARPMPPDPPVISTTFPVHGRLGGATEEEEGVPALAVATLFVAIFSSRGFLPVFRG